MGFMNFVNKHIMDVQAPEAKTQAIPPNQVPAVQVGTAAAAPGIRYIDADMVADLNKIVANRLSPYNALQNTMGTLASTIPDETQRTKAAFEMIKVSGANANQVTSAIDMHIEDVKRELKSFEDSSVGMIASRVGQLRNAATALNEENNAALQTVEQLKIQINTILASNAERELQAAQKMRDADVAETEINATITKFNSAVAQVVDNLTAKKAALSTLLV